MLLLAASIAGLTFAAGGASAQSYADNEGYYDNQPENVIVVGPRYHRERGHLGGPIETVSASRDVSFRDLDLRTHYGAHKLHQRIKSTARTLCNSLDNRYPVTADNSPDCYSNAVQEAMLQADDAIAQARR
jgi:UrcA family protein